MRERQKTKKGPIKYEKSIYSLARAEKKEGGKENEWEADIRRKKEQAGKGEAELEQNDEGQRDPCGS